MSLSKLKRICKVKLENSTDFVYTVHMSNITVKISPSSKGKKFLVEIDADKLERLASNLGLYNPDFIKSVESAERDFRAGKSRTLTSLRKLRSA